MIHRNPSTWCAECGFPPASHKSTCSISVEEINSELSRLRADIERLSAGFDTAYGALLCIGGSDSNWSEYARKVAGEAAAIRDPRGYEQERKI